MRIDLTTPPPPPADLDEDTQPRPERRRRSVLGFVAAAVLVVLALGAVAAFGLFGGFRSGGERAAQQYLDAIAAGDGDRANALGDPASRLGAWGAAPTAVQLEHLSGGGLATATERISSPSVSGSVTRPPTEDELLQLGPGVTEVAEVATTYRLGGRERRADLTVGHVDGEWRILSPLVSGVAFTSGSGGAGSVGGTAIDLEGAAPASATVYLYPGVYTLGGAPDGWFTRPSADVAIAPDGNGLATIDIDLSGRPTPALVAALQTALDEIVQTCAPARTGRLDCGVVFDLGAVTGALLLPRIDAIDGSTFTSTGGSAVVAPIGRVGEAVVDYLSPSGTYAIENGAVVITSIA